MKHRSAINLLPKNRTRLIGGLGSLALVTFGFMLWTITEKPFGNRTASISDAVQSGDPENPSYQYGKPKQLSTSEVNSVVFVPVKENIRYYESQTGRAFELRTLDQSTTTLSDQRLSSFIRTIWSPSGEEVISIFAQPNGTQFKYFSYTTQKSSVIGSSPTSVAFSPSGDAIVFADQDSDVTRIFIAKPDGTEARKLLDTRAIHVSVAWPQKDSIAITSERADTTNRDVLLLDTNGDIETLLSNRSNLERLWSPDGTKMLFSYATTNNPLQLWYMDSTDRQPHQIPLSTSAAKCAWSTDASFIVCGVPTNGLPGDIATNKAATLDDIVSFDLAMQTTTKIYSANKSTLLGVSEPILSPSGHYFVFTNLFSRQLYGLSL